MTLSLWKSHTSKKINCLLPRDEIFPHNYYQVTLRRKKWRVTNTNDKHVYIHFCLFLLNFPDYFFCFPVLLWYYCLRCTIRWFDTRVYCETMTIVPSQNCFLFFWRWWYLISTLNTFEWYYFWILYLIFIFKFFLPSETFPGISIHVVKNVKFRK